MTDPVLSPLYSLAVVAFLAATVLLVVAVVRVARTLLILSRGQAVLAVVGGDGSAGDPVRLRYNTLDGDPVTVPCPSGLRTVAAGDRLPLVYLPHKTGSEAVLDSRVLWHTTALVAAAGLVLAAAGSFALWWAPDPRQPLDDLLPTSAAEATASPDQPLDEEVRAP